MGGCVPYKILLALCESAHVPSRPRGAAVDISIYLSAVQYICEKAKNESTSRRRDVHIIPVGITYLLMEYRRTSVWQEERKEEKPSFSGV